MSVSIRISSADFTWASQLRKYVLIGSLLSAMLTDHSIVAAGKGDPSSTTPFSLESHVQPILKRH